MILELLKNIETEKERDEKGRQRKRESVNKVKRQRQTRKKFGTRNQGNP